ncbi:MAG TPA: VapE domain-containing protein [Rhodocyclaceae bacterium]|nr:VapE domain-containing protein [Rhodocyclaceae bacterium]
MADFDFKRLADAALARADSLLAEWLPHGKRVGHEWKSTNPRRADNHEGSFSISVVNGRWGDFATDDKGGDLLSLYAYLFCNDDQGDAARYLAGLFGMPECVPAPDGKARPKPAAVAQVQPETKPEKVPDWVPVMPVPDDAPAPPAAHEFRGLPEMSWPYRDAEGRLLGFIHRFVKSTGGKEIAPLTYCRNTKSGKCLWRWMAFPDPRPLYGLDRLAAMPDATVLLVEGEKCRDAAQVELLDVVVMAWPGGAQAVDKVDWSPLAGRKVVTWADCDAKREKLTVEEKQAGIDPLSKPLLPEAKQPGVKAMAKVRALLGPMGCKLWNMSIPAPLTVPDGWDVADMLAEWRTAGVEQDVRLAGYVREHAQLCMPDTAPQPYADATPTAAKPSKRRDVDNDHWRDRLLWRKGELADCLANVFDIMGNRDEWQGVLAYDEFALIPVKLQAPPFHGGEVGEWTSADDSRTAIWLTRAEGITPSSARVMEAVEVLSRAHSFHPVHDFLNGLPKHDGTKRIDHWIADCLGVADTPYVRLVSRFFLIGMVARVMEPGVKFDTCLVLEGTQGKGKSTALSILAGEFFDDTDLDLQSKDAMASLGGVWLHEFAELGSLAKAEASKQKSFLTRRIDKYRPVYGRRDIKAPRQVVFAGSVNDWEWQKDPTGGRRFWPVSCDEVMNLDLLRANRPQLFAEALAAYKSKERFWPTAEEQKALFDPEQLMREQPDSYIDALHDWVYKQVTDFSVAIAVMEGLKMDASKLTRDVQTRVGIALRKLGCTRVEKRNGMTRYWYRPPIRNEATSETETPAADYLADEEVASAGF